MSERMREGGVFGGEGGACGYKGSAKSDGGRRKNERMSREVVTLRVRWGLEVLRSRQSSRIFFAFHPTYTQSSHSTPFPAR